MSRVYLSAAHKSSGKTTISIGLCAALHRRGFRVQPFKKGPDYIDPLWLGRASGSPCYNLDFNTQTHDEITTLFNRHQQGADIAFIEGNKGLFDGMDPLGSDCNAAMAKHIDSPVLLVVNVQGITRGVAPLVLGYQQFDPDIQFAGIILNKVASERHEGKLRAVLAEYTDLEVFGAVRNHEDLHIDERHLGLVPSNEHGFATGKIDVLYEHIDRQVDIDLLVDRLDMVRGDHMPVAGPSAAKHNMRIGIAQDSAFGFYYQDDLEAFGDAGAELVPINLIEDGKLPQLDGLFIGGGFPETHMQALAENRSMRESVRQAIENNLPVYAECGGLMYLCRSISWQGAQLGMAGALPADVVMHDRPQGRGYVKLRETQQHPWPVTREHVIAAHEFHHSSLVDIGDNIDFAYDVLRGKGIANDKDGIVYRNTLASYSHLRDTRNKHWVAEFVKYVKSCREV